MKTAIFYDLENIGLASKNGSFEREFNALLQKIKSSELVGEIAFQRAYIRETHQSLPQIEPVAKKLGIDLIPVKPVTEDGRKKTNLVDFKMCIDAVAAVATKRGIKTVAIASGDNDFGFLCQQIKEMGKKLLVISHFATTGASMMRLCDDWLDLDARTLTPKHITKAIMARIVQSEPSGDFFTDFNTFLGMLEEDLLIRRYMASFGLPFPNFHNLLLERKIAFPKYAKLGFLNLAAFLEALLNSTSFEYKSGYVRYAESKPPVSQTGLLINIIRLPAGYTREKLLRYHDILNNIENAEELWAYINFMKHNGMLKDNKLCKRQSSS